MAGEGMWIVSVVQWTTDESGKVTITQHDAKAFRNTKYASDRFDDVVESLTDRGYSMRETEYGHLNDMYGFRVRDDGASVTTCHAAVFMGRNG